MLLHSDIDVGEEASKQAQLQTSSQGAL